MAAYAYARVCVCAYVRVCVCAFALFLCPFCVHVFAGATAGGSNEGTSSPANALATDVASDRVDMKFDRVGMAVRKT